MLILLSQAVFSRSASFAFPAENTFLQPPAAVQPSAAVQTPEAVQPSATVQAPEAVSETTPSASQPEETVPDTLSARSDTLRTDSIYRKPFLEDIISGNNQDSLVYDLRSKIVYIYEKGDIRYQTMNLKADFMQINMETKEVFAHGRPDTTQTQQPEQEDVWSEQAVDTLPKNTRPEFIDGTSSYTMDTITYNLGTKKARVKGVATQQGEGYLQGKKVKMLSDNTINIAQGRYTTCDAENPHFYLAMTKSKTIPNKKTVFGPAYIVMEDVPIYFLGLPFGFFPMSSGRHSGFIMPEYGEEMRKGFYIRNGGYYIALNDYVDLAVTGGIYTQGSWEASLSSQYVKRYKYRGSFTFNFSKDKVGEEGDKDFYNNNNFQVAWTHTQDPKFKPGTTFSASVNFSSSGYNKYSSQDLNQYLSNQTNSSIAFTKNWAGTPFSFSTNFQHSQNSRDSSIQLTFPNIVFTASRITPFQRKNAVGRAKWYEKISMSYNFKLTNSVRAKENELFSENTLKNMSSGVSHEIPINTSFNLLKYFNFTPQFNYNENWYFRRIDKEWDPIQEQVVNADTTYGFYRLYNYRFSLSASTKIYGTYQFKKKDGLIRAIRHLITPTASFNYTPDFGKPGYGYYSQVQCDTVGNMQTYSPFDGNAYSVPSNGPTMGLSFGLVQSLEMKVRDRRDTSGMRKIKLIDEFSITSSYNFLAEEFKLAPFNVRFRTTLYKNVALNLSAVFDPYKLTEGLRDPNKLTFPGRLTNASTSFGYSFNSSNRTSQTPAINDINSGITLPADQPDMFAQPGFNEMDPALQRQIMTSRYYDFSIPWNFGFNYSFSYSKPTIKSNITQTINFNGSVNLTPKWGITFSGGYDLQARKLTPGTITVSRDLHCWQMNFSWIPTGFLQSWSFTIAVKASTLKDLKYDRRRSNYDSIYDQ